MKTLWPVLAVLISTAASANWVAIPRAADVSPETFIDTGTVRQTGPMATMRRVWQLSNRPPGGASGIGSIKSLVEYDCKDRRVRVLEVGHFADVWARGDKLDVAAPDLNGRDWIGIAKGSLGEAVFLRVCPHDGT